ncbi:hypothetical protein PENANT_c031G05951 [Penicillium antarcticum]|uniref:DUF7053 domain-containing protein n=1 Tax=Penicillium antarcticum TaxID=416450 RepID=A0A1V6PV22_9EURO|nr:uncharacterized protein N7508_005603 [Penicillium antarcticum]KAJ5306588.1 hypothetical protein N7508_005603 [Penicillium antarcticum]OQD80803.1 hypothetical protein PENANT_c031G05951 [Penicillium antarcticum]
MMRKKEAYTQITPIPSNVPRQLALDILHSHSEIITLNPLVLSHRPIKAPRDAVSDEYYSTWYEITERVQYLPGLGKMGSGKISFKGCFHDETWGLKTHTYAPMSIDLQSKWRIAGNQPDEPPDLEGREPRSAGAPANGLYLREDVEISCNLTLMSFVKGQLKAASKVLVDRLIKKAELLDEGALQAMMEDGKLRTFNPADRSSLMMSPSVRYSDRERRRSSRWSSQASECDYDNEQESQGSQGSQGRGSVSGWKKYSLSPRYNQEQKGFIAELPADTYHPRPSPGVEKYSELPSPDMRFSSNRYDGHPAELPQ